MSRPKVNEYNSYFKGYISLVIGESSEEIKLNHNQKILEFWNTISLDKWTYSYAEGKWTLKQVLQHVIDTERILAYRALCIVRGEKQNLNEFDQDNYANFGHAINRNIDDLITEWKLLRESNNLMFKSFTEKDLNKKGAAGLKTLSVKAILYIIFGHPLHHINIVNEKYLS
tara:strand:+ start:999 stop:1511 length:513 start_codon:yes stop_codon:yes gene_type:complete